MISSFGDHLDVVSVFGWYVENSFFGESLAIWSLLRPRLLSPTVLVSSIVRAIVRARSHHVVLSSGLLWVNRSPMCTLLGALSSRFGNESCQAIPLRAVCPMTSAYLNGTEKMISSRMDNFARCSSGWQYIKSPLTLQTYVLFFASKLCHLLLHFHLAQGFLWRASRRVAVEEDQRVTEIRLHMEPTALLLVRLHGAPKVDKFSTSSQSGMSKSPDHPSYARDTYSMHF